MLEINKVYNLDYLDFLSQIDDNSIDLLIIDPPYLNLLNDKSNWDNKELVNDIFINHLFRILKDTGSLYLFCGLGEQSQSLIRWFPIFKDKFYFKDMVVWKKNRGNGMKKGYLYTREEILWFVKDNNKFFWNENNQYTNERRLFKITNSKNKSNYKRITNVITHINEVGYGNSVHNFNKLREEYGNHLCPKPVELIKLMLSVSSKENDLVLDCFAGSGSTVLASLESKRNFVVCDNDINCVENINKRINKFLEVNRIF